VPENSFDIISGKNDLIINGCIQYISKKHITAKKIVGDVHGLGKI
jgi:hypothetical protein